MPACSKQIKIMASEIYKMSIGLQTKTFKGQMFKTKRLGAKNLQNYVRNSEFGN